MASPNGDIYEGLLVSGLRSGKGKMTYANGTVYYEGDFLNVIHMEYGKYTFANSDVYK